MPTRIAGTLPRTVVRACVFGVERVVVRRVGVVVRMTVVWVSVDLAVAVGVDVIWLDRLT